MTEHAHSTSAAAEHHRDATTAELTWPQAAAFTSVRPHRGGRLAAWGDGLRMIAVTTERLVTASDSPEVSGYLPTVPTDSEERILD